MKSWTLLTASLAIVASGTACSDETEPANVGGSTTTTAGGMGGTAAVTTSNGGGGDMQMLPPIFEVTGTVVDENGTPVEGASVLQGGFRDTIIATAADGTFTIDVSYGGQGTPGVVAFKTGYRTGGVEFLQVPDAPAVIMIRSVADGDNPSYAYQDPGTGVDDPTTAKCGHCHASFARDFQLSKHREAASDPHVHDLYAGVASAITNLAACTAAGGAWLTGLDPGSTNTTSRCYLGGGVLPDLNVDCGGPAELACDDPALASADQPTAFGQCADCHAPGMSGTPGGRDLLEVSGLAFDNGVFCDVCHKASDVDLTKPPGVGSDLRLVLNRPSEPSMSPVAEWIPLMYGPLIDVPNGFMGAAVQPKFNEAVFCAGCHQQQQAALVPGDSLDAGRWPDGLPVHSTYQEWQDSPYSQSDTPCQFCHMPPHFELVNTVDVTTLDTQSIAFGYPREGDDKREHVFRGPLYEDGNNPRLIDTALFADVTLSLSGSDLDVTVSLTNVGCGHAVPTGEPMRSVILLVTGQGTGCGTLSAIDGMTVFDIGGATARGVEGADVTSAGATLTWAAGASAASAGMVVRVVRPSATYDDYDGIGLFAGSTLTAQEKGLEILNPVGQAIVLSTAAGQLTLDAAIAVQAGDVLYLGDPTPSTPSDGNASTAYAGAAGYAFARVLTDSAGARQVPHYRAIDIASDNRIPPGQGQTTTHRFDVSGCTDATVNARVLYRPHPLTEAALRGWDAKDYLIASAEAFTTVP